MHVRDISAIGLSLLVSLTLACGRPTTTSPSRSVSAPGSAGSLAPLANGTAAASLGDAVTLKVTAPQAQSPVNDFVVLTSPVTLVASNATGKFAALPILQYRFLVFGPTGTLFQESGPLSAPSFVLTAPLDFDARYTWRARAELGDAVGPWSTAASFIAQTGGYIIGSEIYDPLMNGKTVGEIHGPVTFIPGVGVRMDSRGSYIQYTLPQTLGEGEYSALVTNLAVISNTEDPKDRILTMREGDAAINDNEYRMSVDKRGNGAIAWRFLTGPGPYIETIGRERRIYPFHESLTYFVQATWRQGFFNVMFREGGVTGNTVYDFGKTYSGNYAPFPHRVFIGSPYAPGERGGVSTVQDMIVRQVWVSSRPRPSFANQ